MSACLDTGFSEDRKDMFDEAGLFEKLDRDVVVFQEVIRVFIDDVSGRIKRIAGMVESLEFKLIADEAHTIRGAAATIKVGLFEKEAFDLELAATDEDASRVVDMYGRLKASFLFLRKILEKTIK